MLHLSDPVLVLSNEIFRYFGRLLASLVPWFSISVLSAVDVVLGKVYYILLLSPRRTVRARATITSRLGHRNLNTGIVFVLFRGFEQTPSTSLHLIRS